MQTDDQDNRPPPLTDPGGTGQEVAGRDGLGPDGLGPAQSPAAVSLMVTRRQKAVLRDLGLSDEEIRHMTPAEAHARLGL